MDQRKFNQRPTPTQTLLLQAALLQGATGGEAWRAWRACVDFDQLEAGAFALLPLLYHNLRRQNIADPWLVKCKGIYRRTWSQNQLHLAQVASLLRALHTIGIQPLLLGDTAILLAHYPDYGLRMLHQLDIATPPEQAAPMIERLAQAGWHPQPSQQRPQPHNLKFRQTRHFGRAQGNQFMLHWHIIPPHAYPQGADELWQQAMPARVNQVKTLIQPATDHFLAVCTEDRPGHSIQWIPDAIMLLQGQTTIDWTYLLRRVEQAALTLRMRHALHCLHDLCQAPIPTDVLQQLAEMPVQAFEQWEQCNSPNAAAGVMTLWSEYQRRKWWQQQVGLAHDTVSLPHYLQARFALDSSWQLPGYLGKRCLRRFLSVGNRYSNA